MVCVVGEGLREGTEKNGTRKVSRVLRSSSHLDPPQDVLSIALKLLIIMQKLIPLEPDFHGFSDIDL